MNTICVIIVKITSNIIFAKGVIPAFITIQSEDVEGINHGEETDSDCDADAVNFK